MDDSSDDDDSDEEILDLSASEDEKDVIQTYEAERGNEEDSDSKYPSPPAVPSRDFPRKPLPPLPKGNLDEEESFEAAKNSSSRSSDIEQNEKIGIDYSVPKTNEKDSHLVDDTAEDDKQLLPTYSSEDEDGISNEFNSESNRVELVEKKLVEEGYSDQKNQEESQDDKKEADDKARYHF